MPIASDPDIHHPDLTAVLTRLADSLDRRQVETPDAPSHPTMVALGDQISEDLQEPGRMIGTAARPHEEPSWAHDGHAFGVARSAAMRSWTASNVD